MTLALTLSALIAAPAQGSSPFNSHAASADDPAAHAAEQALIARVRTGDAAAFGQLMEQYFPMSVRFAARFFRERTDAEDIAQEVFSRIWTGREMWEPTVSIRAYVLGSIRHRALNILKHQGVEARYAVSAATADDERTEHDAAAALEQSAEIAALRVAIDELPERRKVALTLRYEHGMSHAEVGAALGVTTKAAKELLARTLEALHTRLAKLR